MNDLIANEIKMGIKLNAMMRRKKKKKDYYYQSKGDHFRIQSIVDCLNKISMCKRYFKKKAVVRSSLTMYPPFCRMGIFIRWERRIEV